MLPAEPPDKKGRAPDRQRWAGVVVHARRTNITSHDPYWDVRFDATADTSGEYLLPLNPGRYLVTPYDPERLKDMAITPLIVDVEPGRFTEFVIDYDKFEMKHVKIRK